MTGFVRLRENPKGEGEPNYGETTLSVIGSSLLQKLKCRARRASNVSPATFGASCDATSILVLLRALIYSQPLRGFRYVSFLLRSWLRASRSAWQ